VHFTFILALRNLILHWNRHILTSLGLVMGMMGIVLFGGYVIRMEAYLATHTIFLRQVGHVSLFKKEAVANYQQNPAKYSFNLTEQTAILRALQEESDSVKLTRLIPIAASPAMLTNGCQNFPVWVQGIAPEDMKWLYGQKEVQEKVPELALTVTGQHYWETTQELAANTSPILWSFLDKEPLNSISDETRAQAAGILNCEAAEAKRKLSFSNDLQLFSQDFYGGLGLVDTTVVGLKYSGFSLVDEVFYSTSLQAVQNLTKSDNIYKWALYFEDSKDLAKNISTLERALKKHRIGPLELIPFTDARVSELYVGSMSFVLIMFLFFIVLICGVVVLTVFNSLQIAFLERGRDIAIYKSIGFRNSVITGIFQIEYLLISLVTSLFAGLGGLWIAGWNNSMNFRFQLPGFSSTVQFRLEPSLGYILFVFVFMVLIVQAVSFLQIQRMLKKQSAELMRFDS
jgi:putative ABC transport system permease protein